MRWRRRSPHRTGRRRRRHGGTTGHHHLAEIRTALRDGGLQITETGLGSGLNEEIDQPALAEKRYEILPSSREFELYVFGSAADARQAVSGFRDTEFVSEGGGLVRAGNVIAAFPDYPSEFRGYRLVVRILTRLVEPAARNGLNPTEVALGEVVARPRKFDSDVISVTGTVSEPLRGGGSDFTLVLGGRAKGERLPVVPDDAEGVVARLEE